MFNKIAIIGINNNYNVINTLEYLINILIKNNIAIYLEIKTAINLSYKFGKGYTLKVISDKCEIVIIVGGDGNFIHFSKKLSLIKYIPIIGINVGNLGFLMDIDPNEISTKLFKILSGKYKESKRFMIEVSINDDTNSAFNDIIISSGKESKLFEINVNIDEHNSFNQRSDGIIFSTPTGSTGHNLSAGGPIVDPQLNVIILVPILSHSLNNRPIVLNSTSIITITIGTYNNPKPILIIDGYIKKRIYPGNIIKINKCNKFVTIFHPSDYNYFKVLNSKLHWGKMLFT